jgi:hypothetical protein
MRNADQKTLAQLYCGNKQVAQVTECGIAGTEITQRDSDAARTQCVQNRQAISLDVDCLSLDNFHLDAVRRQFHFRQQCTDMLWRFGVAQFLRAYVDTHRQIPQPAFRPFS